MFHINFFMLFIGISFFKKCQKISGKEFISQIEEVFIKLLYMRLKISDSNASGVSP
jgi:hypothetical protein